MKKLLLTFVLIFGLHVGAVYAEEVVIVEEGIPSSEVEIASTTEEVIEEVIDVQTPEPPEVIETPIPSVNINLEVYTSTTTLYSGPIEVEACSYDGVAPISLSAYCAIKKTGLSAIWSNFGDDYFLDSIEGASNEFMSNMYWLWFSEYDLGSVAMNKHLLRDNENILVTIGRNPMKIIASTSTPVILATTSIQVLEFGFDNSFAPIYIPSASSTLSIDGVEFELGSDGVMNLIPISTSTISVSARKSGFLNPKNITLYPKLIEEIATTTEVSREDSNSTSPTSGGGGSAQRQFDVSRAIDFLIQNQESSGKIISELYTDWAVFALVNSGRSAELEKLKNYLISQSITGDSVTDYERRAMSFMALGINPYNGSNINYIEKIISYFDGTQIGDSNIVNDDIFAVIVLTDSGYSENDEIIKRLGEFIVSRQEDNGSFAGSIDMTGAGLQALSKLGSGDDVVRSKNKAKEFLLQAQRDDGGFGDVFATAWTSQGLSAIGESPQNIFKGGKNFKDYFASLHGSDGGLLDSSYPMSSRVWATSYAIPAYGMKTWSSIMSDFSKPNVVASNSGGGGSVSFAQSDNGVIATSTNSTSTSNNLMIEATTSMTVKKSAEIGTTPDNPIENISTSTNNLKYISPRLSSAPKKVDEASEVLETDISTTSNLIASTINSNSTMQTVAFVFLGLLGVGISGLIFRRFVTVI